MSESDNESSSSDEEFSSLAKYLSSVGDFLTLSSRSPNDSLLFTESSSFSSFADDDDDDIMILLLMLLLWSPFLCLLATILLLVVLLQVSYYYYDSSLALLLLRLQFIRPSSTQEYIILPQPGFHYHLRPDGWTSFNTSFLRNRPIPKLLQIITFFHLLSITCGHLNFDLEALLIIWPVSHLLLQDVEGSERRS